MKKLFVIWCFIAAISSAAILQAQQACNPPCGAGRFCSQHQTCQTCVDEEICDGEDNNCNGAVDDEATCPGDETCISGSCGAPHDSDGDGFTTNDDCNDNDAAIHPEAAEVCDHIDNNCDGTLDNGEQCRCFPPASFSAFLEPAQQQGEQRPCAANLSADLLPNADRSCTIQFGNANDPVLFCSQQGHCLSVEQRRCDNNQDCQRLIDSFGWMGNLKPECTAANVCKCEGDSCSRCVTCTTEFGIPQQIVVRSEGLSPIPCRRGILAANQAAADLFCTNEYGSRENPSYCGALGRCLSVNEHRCTQNNDCIRLRNEYNYVGILETCNAVGVCSCDEATGGCIRCTFPEVAAQITPAVDPTPAASGGCSFIVP